MRRLVSKYVAAATIISSYVAIVGYTGISLAKSTNRSRISPSIAKLTKSSIQAMSYTTETKCRRTKPAPYLVSQTGSRSCSLTVYMIPCMSLSASAILAGSGESGASARSCGRAARSYKFNTESRLRVVRFALTGGICCIVRDTANAVICLTFQFLWRVRRKSFLYTISTVSGVVKRLI